MRQDGHACNRGSGNENMQSMIFHTSQQDGKTWREYIFTTRTITLDMDDETGRGFLFVWSNFFVGFFNIFFGGEFEDKIRE